MVEGRIGELSYEAEVKQDSVNFGFGETTNLSQRVLGARNRSQDQGMIKGHYQRAMPRSPQYPAEPDFLATIAQEILSP